jgi:hypothetical protein
MPIIFIKNRQQSGNHGGNEQTAAPLRMEQIISTVPQQSGRSFAPPAQPVKKSPSIKDLIHDPAIHAITVPVPDSQPIEKKEISASEISADFEIIENKDVNSEKKSEIFNLTAATELSESSVSLETIWINMVDFIFSKTAFAPTFKTYIPEYQNNIITVKLINAWQKEEFGKKMRECLSYLRSHWNEKIEDILLEVNEEQKTKGQLFDTQSKINRLQEENEELIDFLRIMNLRPKDE